MWVKEIKEECERSLVIHFFLCAILKKKKHFSDLSAKLQIEKAVMKWFSAFQINVSMDMRKKLVFFPVENNSALDSSYTCYMLSSI